VHSICIYYTYESQLSSVFCRIARLTFRPYTRFPITFDRGENSVFFIGTRPYTPTELPVSFSDEYRKSTKGRKTSSGNCRSAVFDFPYHFRQLFGRPKISTQLIGAPPLSSLSSASHSPVTYIPHIYVTIQYYYALLCITIAYYSILYYDFISSHHYLLYILF